MKLSRWTVPRGQRWEIYANGTVSGLPPDGQTIKLESFPTLNFIWNKIPALCQALSADLWKVTVESAVVFYFTRYRLPKEKSFRRCKAEEFRKESRGTWVMKINFYSFSRENNCYALFATYTAKNQWHKFETNIPEKEFRSHSPNFHNDVSASDLYISRIDLPILLQEKGGLILVVSLLHSSFLSKEAASATTR